MHSNSASDVGNKNSQGQHSPYRSFTELSQCCLQPSGNEAKGTAATQTETRDEGMDKNTPKPFPQLQRGILAHSLLSTCHKVRPSLCTGDHKGLLRAPFNSILHSCHQALVIPCFTLTWIKQLFTENGSETAKQLSVFPNSVKTLKAVAMAYIEVSLSSLSSQGFPPCISSVC